MSDVQVVQVGKIGNYYGGLSVKSKNGRFFWSIENYDGNDWQEISESLYRELLKFEHDHGVPNISREPRGSAPGAA